MTLSDKSKMKSLTSVGTHESASLEPMIATMSDTAVLDELMEGQYAAVGWVQVLHMYTVQSTNVPTMSIIPRGSVRIVGLRFARCASYCMSLLTVVLNTVVV